MITQTFLNAQIKNKLRVNYCRKSNLSTTIFFFFLALFHIDTINNYFQFFSKQLKNILV